MIDDQLLVGIVLIAAGVAVGLLAYALVLNRREGRPGAEVLAEAPSELEPEGVKRVGLEEPDGAQAEQVGLEATGQEPAQATDLVETTEVAPQAEAQEAGETIDDALPIPPAEPADRSADETSAAPGGRRAIATLMRDNRTGRLTLVVGDHEYVNPSELKDTNDWFGVEEASRDLIEWLNEAQPPSARARRPPPRARSLVDEVNDILEHKLAEAGLTHRGVRLNEDRDGSVRVYVGLQAYTLDEVPDPEVREVIRQAVAEWEGRK